MGALWHWALQDLWNVGEANEPTTRPSPTNKNTAIYRYHQAPLAGKRLAYKA